MPGRTPTAAFDAFVEPLQSALSCVAVCKLTTVEGGRHLIDTPHALLSNRGGAADVGGPLHLSLRVRMRYKIVKMDAPQDSDSRFKISTLAYSYTVTDRAGTGILDYHWHPDAQSHVRVPHLHIGDAQLSETAVLTSKAHIATGRVSLENVIMQLITDHGVPPRHPDWHERLTMSDARFRLHNTWA